MPIAIPDPPFGDQTEEAVRARMFAAMSSGLDQAQGSMAWDLISPLAIELNKMWVAMDLLVEFGFAQTNYELFLDARAEEHAVTRKVATLATGIVRFTGTDTTVIPVGTQISNTVLLGSPDEPQVFQTSAEGIISGGFVDVAVAAVTAGTEGNLPANSIDRMVTIVALVTAVDNAVATTGGTDDETDDDLRTRLLASIAAQEGAGTSDDYETWALQVIGVGAATTEPLWNGAGTVRVMILDLTFQPASAQLQTDVDDHIGLLRPIGADVTIDTPTLDTHAIVATLTMEPGFTVLGVQSAVEESLQAYYDSLGTGEDVIYTEVSAAVVTTLGVADWTVLTLDGGTVNVVISATQKADLGTVTLS